MTPKPPSNALPLLFLISLALPLSPPPAAANDSPPAAPGDASPLFEKVCSTCHGKKGEGNHELKAPSIAGQPEWYTIAQIGKFRSDMRGIDPEDVPGTQMHAIALTLDEDAARKVAAFIKQLPRIPTTNTLKGDPDKGRILYEENCMECHRYNGSGELAFKSPALVAYQDWYIVAQLKKFRAGTRGTHPKDVEGAKMHKVTGYLESEDDFAHIAAFIAFLAEKYP